MDKQHPPAPGVDVVAFDPYAAALTLRWLAKVPVPSLALVAPIVAVILVAVTAIEGTLGSLGDMQPLQDIRLAIGRYSADPHEPFQYPLLRDTQNWVFAAIMVIEFMIMCQQWRLLGAALPKLAQNGVLTLRGDGDRGASRRRGSIGAVADYPAPQRLAAYVTRVNEHNRRRARWYTIGSAILALALSGLLMWVERLRAFQVFVPRGLTESSQSEWRLSAYQHWWAGLSHPAGAITYFLLVALAIHVILLQTHVGISAARIASALPRLARVDANWVNPDGHYGWGPIHKIFDTVWSSMALYGLMVSILAVVLGLGSVGWIPAAIWFVLVTFYFVVPWIALRKIAATVKERRIDIVAAEARATTTQEQEELEARVKHYREAKIRPMRLGGVQRVPVLLSVLLPVVLNVAQPFIQTLFSL